MNIQCKTIHQCWQAVETSAWSLIYAAGIRTWWEGWWKDQWWKGRWWWKGWNWMWYPISACYIRICDQWGWIIVDIPIWMFVPKAMCMKNKLLTDEKPNVQTHDDDVSCGEWVICQN